MAYYVDSSKHPGGHGSIAGGAEGTTAADAVEVAGDAGAGVTGSAPPTGAGLAPAGARTSYAETDSVNDTFESTSDASGVTYTFPISHSATSLGPVGNAL